MPKSPALAKLTRPRTHQAVVRERLFNLLDEARTRPVVWIDAPPGSGKTTLVATYLQARGGKEVWYQVDAGDSDPATFFHYLSSAIDDRLRRRLPQLAPEHLADLPAFTRRFFREFFTTASLLVLDNFQEASDALLCELLRHACEEVPETGNVVVISRTEPSSALCELAGRSLLARVDWNDVRLTLEETRAMSTQRGIAEDWVVRALHQQAEGWAAGVILMLERFKRAGGGSGELSGETRQDAFNYFASLIFDQASDNTKHILLSLAFLPRFTPGIAVAASGDTEAGKLLESLHRRQLFTDRRPGQEPVYQFHALFRDFLQARLQQTLPPCRIQSRLLESAQLLISHGEWEAAFDLLIRGEAWKAALKLLLERAQELMEKGRWQTVVRWAESLAAEEVAREPWLQYWLATARAQMAPVAAVPMYASAMTEFERLGDRAGAILSTAGLLQVCSFDHVDYANVEKCLDRLAEEVITTDLLSPEQRLTSLSALVWSAFFVAPWHSCIAPALDRIQELLNSVHSISIRISAAISALTIASQSAQMERSRSLREVVQQLALSDDTSPLLSCWGRFQVAHSFFLDAAYEDALDQFDQIWLLAQKHDLRNVLTAALMHRFMVDFRLADLRAAEATMKRIEALPAPATDYSRSLLACYRARFAQLRGDLTTGAAFARESQIHMVKTGSRFHEFIFGLINAEMLMRAGRLADALPMLLRSKEIVQRSPILEHMQPSVTMVESWSAALSGDRIGSEALLQKALSGSRTGYGWCQMRYVDTTLAHMLPIALEENIEADQARWLIRTFRLRPPSPDIDRWPWPLRIRTLGNFSVHIDEHPLEAGRKTPRKVLALLKALIALGPREVPEQHLIDALWPDEDGDAGHKALSITVLRLRRLLGNNDLIRQQAGKLSIDAQRCWVDAWSFERRLSANQDVVLDEILPLYQGSFLPDDTDAAITVATRERLRAKFVHALGDLGRQLEAQQRHEEAIGWYLRGLEADAIIETFYQGLMRCYTALDRRTEAIASYRRLKQTLSVTLGLAPSAATERLYLSTRGD